MTEAEWLACNDPRPLLEFMRGRASDRKLRLFACACGHRIRELHEDDRLGDCAEVAQRHAEVLATEQERETAYRCTTRIYGNATLMSERDLRVALGAAMVREAVAPKPGIGDFVDWGLVIDSSALCALVRDVIGNPF